MNQITIETNIPLPPKGVQPGSVRATLKSMNVGESFIANLKNRASISGQAGQVGIKLVTRKNSATQVRVWRTA
jgi:hypothetical protein